MSGINLVLVLLVCAFNIGISWMKEKTPDTPWYKNYARNLAVVSLLCVALSETITYSANNRSRQQARHQAEKLNAKIGALENQNRRLVDQNQVLGVQIGDCNAMIQGVRTKLHAPTHFKRRISDTAKTTDSLSVGKKKK